MRWLPLLLPPLLVLTACPARQAADSAPAGTATEAAGEGAISGKPAAAGAETTAAPEYPPAAIAYLVESLAQPMQPGYPPLEGTWLSIARLEQLDQAALAAPLRSAVREAVDLASGEVLPELAAAWLATEPEAAAAYIGERLAAGDTGYLLPLNYNAALGRELLPELTPAQLEALGLQRVARLIQNWWELTAADAPLLKRLTAGQDDTARLLATGMLVSLGEANEAQRQELRDAVRGEPRLLAAAAEAIRLSGDGAYAEALVLPAARAELGEPDPEAGKEREPLFAAYALTTLPGEQAARLRRKLLGAVDPLLRWQARLGELFNGAPEYWRAALDKGGIADYDLWVALEPGDVWHEDLLPTYVVAAAQGEARYRALAALQLNRYRALASNPVVAELVLRLTQDIDANTQAVAWYTAAELGMTSMQDRALAVVADGAGSARVRLAAAFCALKLVEAQAAGGKS